MGYNTHSLEYRASVFSAKHVCMHVQIRIWRRRRRNTRASNYACRSTLCNLLSIWLLIMYSAVGAFSLAQPLLLLERTYILFVRWRGRHITPITYRRVRIAVTDVYLHICLITTDV